MDVKNRLDALSGLRCVAAAAVATAHLPGLLFHPGLGLTSRRLLAEGFYGLTMFFILSGFVLAYTYHERLARPTRREIGRYALARVARVWPLHLLTLALAAMLMTTPHDVGTAVANAFLVHAWVPDIALIQSYNSVSWTLSHEAFFYAVTPLLLLLAGRWRSAGPGAFLVAAVVIWLVQLGVVLTFGLRPGMAGLYLSNACPAVRLGEFAVGLALGMAYVRSGADTVGPPSRREWWRWTALEVAVVAAVVVLVYQSHRVPLQVRYSVYYTPAVAAVVAVFARGRGALSAVIGSRVPVYLSDISFAFYLLHAMAFTQLHYLLGPSWGVLERAAVMVGVTGLAAMLLHHGFEAPMRSWLVGLGRSRKDRAAVRPGLLARLVARLRPGRRTGNIAS